MREPRTPSNVTLTLLDLTRDEAEATEFVRKQAGATAEDSTRAEFGQRKVAAIEVNGKIYALGEEGVGQEVTDEIPLTLDIFSKSDTGFGIFPVATASLTPDEVRARMTGEPVLLEDLIRRFGARLEANYAIWLRTLSPAALAHDTVSASS